MGGGAALRLGGQRAGPGGHRSAGRGRRPVGGNGGACAGERQARRCPDGEGEVREGW